MPVTKYIWDEDNLLAETDGSNVVQTVYTNEPEQYGNLVSTRLPIAGTPTTVYHHFDALGSTRQLTNAAGSVTDTVVYDAWGNAIARTGSANAHRLWLGEVGYYYDIETGLFWITVRPYDPVNGRWATVDLLLLMDEGNRYLYAQARPVLLADPSGRITWKKQSITVGAFTIKYRTGPQQLTDNAVGTRFAVYVSWAKADVPMAPAANKYWLVAKHKVVGIRVPQCKVETSVDQYVRDIITVAKVADDPNDDTRQQYTDIQGMEPVLPDPYCWYRDNITVALAFDQGKKVPFDPASLNDLRNAVSIDPSPTSNVVFQFNNGRGRQTFKWNYDYWNYANCCKCLNWLPRLPGFISELMDTPFFEAFNQNADQWGG